MSVDTAPKGDIQATPESHIHNIELNYIFWYHDSMELVPKVIDAANDSDIVLFEQYGGSPELRDANQNLVNDLWSGVDISTIDNFPDTPTGNVMKAFAATGKEAYFIDAPNNLEDIAAIHEEQGDENRKLNEMFYDAPSEKIAAQLSSVALLTSDRDRRRDQLMQKQIQELIGKQTQDKRIAILVGASHSPISHKKLELPHYNVQAHRTWLDQNENTPPVKFHFDATNELVREYYLADEEPSPERIKQVVATRYLDGYMQIHPGIKAVLSDTDKDGQNLLSSIDEICLKQIDRRQKFELIDNLLGSTSNVDITELKDSVEEVAA